VVLARRQVDRSRELQAAYERYVADFYNRKGLDSAANYRLRKLSSDFPGTKAVTTFEEESLGDGKLANVKKLPGISAAKAPGVPKVVNSEILSEGGYTQTLRQMAGNIAGRSNRLKNSIEESSLIISESVPEAPKILGGEKSLVDFSCDETQNGTIFIATLTAPLIYPVKYPLKDEADYVEISWEMPSPGVHSQNISTANDKKRCSAGEISIEILTNSRGISLKLPEGAKNKASFILLNRPSRVVLSVQE